MHSVGHALEVPGRGVSVALTLRGRRIEKAAKLGSWAQVMKHLHRDLEKSELHSLGTSEHGRVLLCWSCPGSSCGQSLHAFRMPT